MKLVMLVDGNKSNFEQLIDNLNNKKSYLVDTQNCDETHEYNYLLRSIKSFSQSNSEIMLAKFSGRESIVRDLGDESPEMILSLSYNKNSRYYTECPINTFVDLITIFDKETN